MSVINTGQIGRFLIPGINTVWGLGPDYGPQFKEIYGTAQKSYLFQEYDVETKNLTAAKVKPEGSPTASDGMGQRFVTSYIHKTVSQSYGITWEAIGDNQYKKEFPEKTLSLKQSLVTTKNILGAAVLNNAFDSNFPMGDGQPLCSNNHPVDNGVFSNRAGGNDLTVDFSEAGIEDGVITIQMFVNQAGIPLHFKDRKIVIQRNNQFAAGRILESQFQNDTANNAVNMLNKGGYMPEGYTVNQYLSSPAAWFILTSADNGFKHYQRADVELDSYTDFPTKTLMVSGMERYSFGCSNVRAVYGSPGA